MPRARLRGGIPLSSQLVLAISAKHIKKSYKNFRKNFRIHVADKLAKSSANRRVTLASQIELAEKTGLKKSPEKWQVGDV